MLVEETIESRSLSEVHETVDTTRKTGRWRKLAAFMGPAYLVSVGYMDPGNWATDLAGGSKFGYSLLWVLLMSNMMALLLQGLSARLGIVRGRDLAQANRELYPKSLNFILYLLAEVAIAATDLAEVLGMAIGLNLLTGLPILWGVIITALDTFLLLFLQRLGMRKMEAFIIALVAVIGISFLIQILMAQPNMAEVVTGFIPSFQGKEALYIAIGIIGATVMPHNLYLHSALVQTRKITKDDAGIKRAIKGNMIDSVIALNLAFFVNAAILILAATVFFKTGRTDVAEIKIAHELLPNSLGKLAPILFAIALIAAGQSSTITGTLAGQIVMEGYLKLRINPWVRRLLTRLLAIIPAVIFILINGENNLDRLLILSQVVLSLQLGFAIIPLIHAVSDKKSMQNFAIKPLVKFAAWLITAVLICLNISMVFQQASDFIAGSQNFWLNALIIIAGIFFLLLILFVIVFPMVKKERAKANLQMHKPVMALENLVMPEFNRIAIALDFSSHDDKIIAYALSQGNAQTKYVLLHVVESATAKVLGQSSDDYETRKDQQQLDDYVAQLKAKGHQIEGMLGFRNRVPELVRLVKENDAQLLVIGSHGHRGLKDVIYGSTIDAVRHQLSIPVFIVNV
jgi:manganese transport protein